MSAAVPQHLRTKLATFGQEQVLRWWDDLAQEQRRVFAQQLETLDLDLLARLHNNRDANAGESPAERARRAVPPSQTVRLSDSAAALNERSAAARKGLELLAAGRVGAILVAGGQGTRLGFPHPKGMFPIGPVSGHSLFQIFAEQLLARSRQAGTAIPYFIMTSDATHDETVAFFDQQGYFGLNREDVFFFRQGNMPAVDAGSGGLLLCGKGEVCLSPDGHGGILKALHDAGLLDEMKRRGIEYLFYHQVDNPTAIVCEPTFLGLHALRESELTTKVVAKVAPEEKMGVVVEVDGRTQIIEYSDLPDDVAGKTDSSGGLLFWAGNTGIHVFSRSFLERLAGEADSLPFHVARKAVPHLNDAGELVTPEKPNAHKFERFIFDALPHARTALVVEGDRAHEFNPVKNAEGSDSPKTAREALRRLHAEWLRTAGQDLPEDATVEIGPLFALDDSQVRDRLKAGELMRRVFLS